MPKNKVFFSLFYLLCVFFLGTNIIFAQQVTDDSKDRQANAASNSDEQQPQPAAAPVNMKMEQQQDASQAMPDSAGPVIKIVKAIDIRGNKSIGIAQILARIKTRVGEPYQDAVISDDLKRLYNTGHFSDVQIDHEDMDDGYKVIVKLKEKPIVDEITFSKIKYYNPRALS